MCYIDDLLVIAKAGKHIDALKERLSWDLVIKNLEQPTSFLGMVLE